MQLWLVRGSSFSKSREKHMFQARIGKIIVLLVLLGVASCSAGRSFDYVDATKEKEGPGLLSGTHGEFVLYEKSKTYQKKSEEQESH